MKELKLTNKSINDVWVKRKVVKDNLRINRLVVMSDADTDGDAICGVILNLINEFWPEMFEQCRVSRVQTPIQIARPKNKRGKEKIFYFLNDITFHEYFYSICLFQCLSKMLFQFTV